MALSTVKKTLHKKLILLVLALATTIAPQAFATQPLSKGADIVISTLPMEMQFDLYEGIMSEPQSWWDLGLSEKEFNKIKDLLHIIEARILVLRQESKVASAQSYQISLDSDQTIVQAWEQVARIIAPYVITESMLESAVRGILIELLNFGGSAPSNEIDEDSNIGTAGIRG